MRKVLAVVVPWLVWGGLDTGVYAALGSINADMFPAAGISPAAPALVVLLVLRAAYSYLAGMVAGRLAQGSAGAIKLAIGLLLATGLFVQITTWDVYPIWYHLVFLISIVPFAAWGARTKGSASA